MINQYLKSLGLLIIYETIRTWIKMHKLTIKTTEQEKEIVIIDPKESYTIIFDNLKYVNMVQEIQSILPTMNLKLIEQTSNRNHLLLELPANMHHKILIISYRMDTSLIENILKGLMNKYSIKLEQIRLACIECRTDQLIQISKLYSHLTIYTTKIIET
jgi:uracil phosphoribosyltransferase